MVASSERPRERCLQHGARCLSLRECLAVLFGSGPPGRGALGLASDVLERPGSGFEDEEAERALFTALEISPLAHLEGIRGLGEAHRARLLAAFELGRRYADHRDRLRRPPPSRARRQAMPEAAIDRVPPELRAESREWLGFVPLHRGGELGGLLVVERGVRTHVNVDPAELFARVLALRPQAFYLFHNHPSGDLTPSPADEDLTRRVAQVARQLGVRLLGHAIVSPRGDRWVVI
jgi:DNA repair protein RadC